MLLQHASKVKVGRVDAGRGGCPEQHLRTANISPRCPPVSGPSHLAQLVHLRRFLLELLRQAALFLQHLLVRSPDSLQLRLVL